MDATGIINSLTAAAERLAAQLEAVVPALLAALAFLFFGWLVGRLLARGVTSLIDRLVPGVEASASRLIAARLGIERRLAEVAGSFVFWIVLAVFALAAVETLGLPVLAAWMGQLGALLPRLFLGGLIVVVGLLVGAVARDAATAAARAGGMERAAFLGRAAQVAVILVAAVTGASQLGIDTGPLTLMVTVTGGALLAGAALAFALGAGPVAGNVIAAHYVQQAYRVGDTVQIGTTTGRIVEITQTAVLIESAEGRVLIPARKFSEEPSVLLPKGE